jgi:hypothetical protein
MVLHSVIRDFTVDEKLTPLSLGAVKAHSDFPRRKAPGLPWSEHEYKDKEAVCTDPVSWGTIQRDWDLIGRGKAITLPDCQTFQRLIACNKDREKVRPVWGYPTAVVVEEGRFFYPWMEWLKARSDDHCYGIGLETALGGMRYLDDMTRQLHNVNNTVIAGLDWSGFDTTVPAWLIRDAFSVLKLSFRFDQIRSSDGRIWPVTAKESERRWKKIVDYFINTTIRLPNGERYKKTSGVPSGSMFTNVVDTICNAIITRYCTFHTTQYLPKGDVYYGDDTYAIIKKPFDVESFARIATESFGMQLNLSKSVVTYDASEVTFLGFYNINGRPKRSMDFLFASFMIPEHRNDDPFETSTRALGQLYSTMYGPDAYTWYLILREIQIYAHIDNSEIEEFVRSNYHRFKFLQNLGLPASEVVVPEYKVDHFFHTVHGIEPLRAPTRSFLHRRTFMPLGINYAWPFSDYEPTDWLEDSDVS